MRRRMRSTLSASFGSRSSMYSGSSQRRMWAGVYGLFTPGPEQALEQPVAEQRDHAESDRHQPDEAQLSVRQLRQSREAHAPQPRRGERQEAFEDQHEGER